MGRLQLKRIPIQLVHCEGSGLAVAWREVFGNMQARHIRIIRTPRAAASFVAMCAPRLAGSCFLGEEGVWSLEA